VKSAITLLRGMTGAEQANIPEIKQLADELGVKAVVPPGLPRSVIKEATACRSILVPTPDA
jgi:hypothetical protein